MIKYIIPVILILLSRKRPSRKRLICPYRTLTDVIVMSMRSMSVVDLDRSYLITFDIGLYISMVR